MGKKFGGGKRKGAGRGGGRGGRGRGRKRKRQAEESGEENAPATKRRGHAARAEAHAGAGAEPEEEEPPPPPRPTKPGFGSLLQAFGVAGDTAEAESDEEDEDDSGSASDAAGEEGLEREGAAEAPEDPGSPGQSEELDDEEEAQDEAEAAAEAEASGKPTRTEGSGADWYPRFWDDPAPALGAEPSTAASGLTRFALPGLARCESHRRDVAGLLEGLREPAAAAAAWKRCGLAPGVGQLFADYLTKQGLKLGPQEGALFLFLHAYLDVAFPQHTHLNAQAVRAVCMLHVVDHLLKATHEVLENSAAARRALEAEGGAKGAPPMAAVADQGFTRGRVLLICPFRSTARELLRVFLALCPSAKVVHSKDRFEREFGPQEGQEGTDESKPADWRHLFDGNNDDRFRIGVTVTRKSVRLYTPFRNSDLLICSPLGLREVTGAEGDWARDFDFLSSIEVCVVERADVLRMQNWEHVREVLDVVNRKPRKVEGIDISRLRPAFADGRARAFRQTVVTSAGQFLDVETLFEGPAADDEAAGAGLARRLRGPSRGPGGRWGLAENEDEDEDEGDGPAVALAPASGSVRNLRGLVRLAQPPEDGALRRATALGLARQFFLHVPCESLEEQGDRLFQAFEDRYWKPLGHSLERLLVVTNTYFAFLRLRQFFREQGVSFCSTFEYSTNSSLSRNRALFFHGHKKLLLVTERFLWYRRYKLKGADYVLFYGTPETPEIYEDVLSAVRTPSQCNSMCLFTRHDGFALERIVGHERVCRMLTSPPGKVFVFN